MLEIKNMGHGFGERTLYDNVNISANMGEKIGLVGANGSGKSTLINILNGKLICDRGEIKWVGKHKVGYLDQHAQIPQEMSILDYLKTAYSELYDAEQQFNALNEQATLESDPQKADELINRAFSLFEKLTESDFYSLDSHIRKIASGLNVTQIGLDTKISALSGGQRAKVILCKLLLDNPDFLILDEPTNHLDPEQVEWLTKYLKDYEGTFLIVSHNIPFLDAICNIIWSVEFNSIVRYKGNYYDFKRQQEEKIVIQDKMRNRQELQINKLEDYIARNKARTATARQAQSRIKQLEKIKPIEKLEEAPDVHFKFQYKPTHSIFSLKIKDLAIGYTQPLVSHLNLNFKFGEKLHIYGFNGLGKTTLLKTIIGLLPPLSGEIEVAKDLKIGYFEQGLNFDNPEITALEQIMHDFPKWTEKEARGALARAGLTAKLVARPIKRLSGGEQSKLKLCKIMSIPINILILDEPTNHLDPKAKASLAKAIEEFPGSVIFVTHENDFATNLDCKHINLADLT